MSKSKREKREEAELRAAERAKRSSQQQINLIKQRRGESKKELTRLLK